MLSFYRLLQLYFRRFVLFLLMSLGSLTLAACALPWQQIQKGDSLETAIKILGNPKENYLLSNHHRRFLWPTKPFGETTIAVDIDLTQKIALVQQVLSNDSFGKAEIDKWTKKEVLSHFGEPLETSYFPLMKRQVWTYRYKDDEVWFMLYHFYFDQADVLKKTQKTPDPLYEPDGWRFF